MKVVSLNTRQNIRNTAQRLFRERGYAAIGMRELARQVGIEAPSIYNHYKSKDDLLREICFDIAAQFFAAFDKQVNPTDKPLQQLKSAITAHVGVIANNLEASEVFFTEWVFLNEPHLGKFKKLRHNYEIKWRTIIDSGIKKGEFKKVNTRLATFTIFSALNATHDLYKSNEPILPEEIAEEISGLLLKGIKA